MADGDRDRFTELYRSHYLDILRYARRRVDADASRDVAAETFLIAWRRLEILPGQPLPWLYATARRALANHLRGVARATRLDARMRAAAVAGIPTVQPDHADRIAGEVTIAGLLLRLAPRDQEALQLIAWEDLDVKDAAAVVGCSPAAMAVRLHRARRRLIQLLQNVPAAEEPAVEAHSRLTSSCPPPSVEVTP